MIWYCLTLQLIPKSWGNRLHVVSSHTNIYNLEDSCVSIICAWLLTWSDLHRPLCITSVVCDQGACLHGLSWCSSGSLRKWEPSCHVSFNFSCLHSQTLSMIATTNSLVLVQRPLLASFPGHMGMRLWLSSAVISTHVPVLVSCPDHMVWLSSAVISTHKFLY